MIELRSAAGRGTLAAAVLASGMAFLDSIVVNVALPALGGELSGSLGDLQWVVSGYTLTLAALVLLGGALGDRYGRRRVFLTGVVWFTAASVACGAAPTIEFLIVARVVQGIGAALLTPGSLALLQSSFDSDDRARAIGAWSGLAAVATLIGPFLGGLLIDSASWRMIFWINAPLAAVVLLLARRYVPESRAAEAASARFDVAGAVLGAAALAGLTYGLIAWPEGGPSSPRVLLGLAVAAISGTAFVTVERARGDRAMLPLRLFGNRVFAGLNVYTLFVYASLSALSFFLIIFLQNAVGYTALEAGLAFTPLTALMLFLSARSGVLATRMGPSLQLVAGPLCCAAGAFALQGVGFEPNYWIDVLPGVALFGLGLTALVAPLTATVLGAIDDRYAGLASGINNAAARAAGLLAVASLPLLVGLSGYEYAEPEPLRDGYRTAMIVCAALLVLAAATAALVRPARVGRSSR